MDASGLHVLQQTQDECRRRGSRMILVGIHAQPLMVLERADLIESLGSRNLYATLPDALRALALPTDSGK